MRFLIIPLTLCFLFTLPALAAQPVVRGVYLTPSGIDPPTQNEKEEKRHALTLIQSYYRNEMLNDHRGSKTFKLKRDADNRVDIHEIEGEKTLEEYRNLVSNGDFDSIVAEIEKDEELGDGFSKDGGEIRVVFIDGMEFLTKNDHATTQSLCRISGDRLCKHYCFIPAASPILSYITAHEMGHAFGLDHNPKGKNFLMYKDAKKKSLNDTVLSADETRWLDCTKYFNDQNTDKSVPIITNVHEPQWVNHNRTIRLGFDIENEVSLHQVYLIRRSDDMVLDYDKIKSRRLTVGLETTMDPAARSIFVRVKILDTHGNYVYYDYDFSRFGRTVVRRDRFRAAPSMFVPHTVVGTWGAIKANR